MDPQQTLHSGRLQGKTAVITGAAGGIGQVIVSRYLDEEAIVILTGRNEAKLNGFKQQLQNDHPNQQIYTITMDNSDPESVATGIQQIIDLVETVDILINNAGSAGPKQPIGKIPLTRADLGSDTETLSDAVGSLLGGTWLVTRALAPYLNHGASIINISTVFSRTEYFGRAAYVVPKAALNELSLQMAIEFGKDDRGIRVNTIFPGPVASERIDIVFDAMDKLRNSNKGTTKAEVTAKMLLRKPHTKNKALAETLYVSKEDIANTLVFLGSDQSSGFTAHDFAVTHGMQLETHTSDTLLNVPDDRTVDLEGKWVWILAISQWQDALLLAQDHNKSGAQVLITLTDPDSLNKLRDNIADQDAITAVLLDPNHLEHWDQIKQFFAKKTTSPHSIIAMTTNDLVSYGPSVLQISSAKVQQFITNAICLPVVITNNLNRTFIDLNSKVIFISSGYNQNLIFNKIQSAGVQELIRVWRHERSLAAKNNAHNCNAIHQIIRYDNNSAANLEITSAWAVCLANGMQVPTAIDLIISPELDPPTFTEYSSELDHESLGGLHMHKVALVTGGSEGIGAQIARLLALAGARVAIASRNPKKLQTLQTKLIAELRAANYAEPESRILMIADADIGDSATPQKIVAQTVAKFGHIDYLINNAGIVGEEQMIVDMSLEGWQTTIKANLTSNYELILLLLPAMRERKSGHILNMSSHFGGLRHATVVYPNRADYALSKSGQRTLAENLAVFLGPEVQINAVAPGPVHGARIQGSAESPGLYQRRAKLILENKRLNGVYDALLKIAHDKVNIDDQLYQLAKSNHINALKEIKEFAPMLPLLTNGPTDASAAQYLLTHELAVKLINRLQAGLYLSKEFSTDKFAIQFQEIPNSTQNPFFAANQITSGAARIRDKMMHALALQRMPTEMDVAREVVFYLANNNVTGETLYPSCGLSLDHFVTVTEWIGDPQDTLAHTEMQNDVIMIFGNSMFTEIAATANAYLAAHASKVIIVARDVDSANNISELITKNTKLNATQIKQRVVVTGLPNANFAQALHQFTETMNAMILQHGTPTVVVSFPMSDLSAQIKGELPSLQCFENLMNEHVTINFVLARRVCLIDHCRFIAVTQPCISNKQLAQDPVAVAFANFFKNNLRTLIATVGAEGNLLSHQPYFFQLEPNGDPNRLVAAIIDLSASDLMCARYHTGMILAI